MITNNLVGFICILRVVTNVVFASNLMSNHDDPFYLPKGYNKDKIPISKYNGPINITVFVEINSIQELSEKDSSVTFNIRLRLSWVDYRLILNYNSSIWTLYGTDVELQYANLDPAFLQKLYCTHCK